MPVLADHFSMDTMTVETADEPPLVASFSPEISEIKENRTFSESQNKSEAIEEHKDMVGDLKEDGSNIVTRRGEAGGEYG